MEMLMYICSMKNNKKQNDMNYSSFTDYVYGFYGTGGVYERFFIDKPISKNEIEYLFQISKKKDPDFWFEEDSLCREVMRDLLFFHREVPFELEHKSYINRFLVKGMYI